MSSERQELNEISPWWGEHIHRYLEAGKHIKPGDLILDIACGNGFGTNLLFGYSKNEIIGADISKDAIQTCSLKFKNNQLKFVLADGSALPFENNYFDVIVSFETIEHTTKYEIVLKEFFRVLKLNGTLMLSTPNSFITSPDGIIKNPFHTQEFTFQQLLNILSPIFPDSKILGQKYIRYNRTGVRGKIGFLTEQLFFLKGFRKIPIYIQNRVMQFLISKNQYADSSDFELVEKKSEILKCKTLFAICKKI